jgi:hypothetical protein
MEFTESSSLAHSSHSPSEEISRILRGEYAEARGVSIGARVEVPFPGDESKRVSGVSCSAYVWPAAVTGNGHRSCATLARCASHQVNGSGWTLGVQCREGRE